MHSPSRSRQLLRALKEGADPVTLLKPARLIPDPDHAARTLFIVGGDRRLPWNEARHAMLGVLDKIPRIEKPSRFAELSADLRKGLPNWRDNARNPDAPRMRERLLDLLKDTAMEHPVGPWTHGMLEDFVEDDEVFDFAKKHQIQSLLQACVRAVPTRRDQVEDALIRAELGDMDALWAEGDEEKIRILLWKPETDPVAFAESAPANPYYRTLAYTLAGARLDKEGKDGKTMLLEAKALLDELPEAARRKRSRKLQQAFEKAGIEWEAPELPEEPQEEEVVQRFEQDGSATRSILGLVDGYQGSVKSTHLRAMARAAPLCVAFNLDLGLYGFPTQDVSSLVAAAAAETNIGEGIGYLQKLLEEGRIHHDEQWTAPVLATTPHPDPERLQDLPKGPCVLLMGLGRQGLPKRFLDGAHGHYEITGAKVSLETATAMGILADRLGGRHD